MDKITHQIRAEYWAKIINECINNGMSKTAWCRANGISKKQFFYWQRILRREAFENSRNSSLPVAGGPDQELAPVTQRTASFTEIKLPSSPSNTAPAFHLNLVIRKGDLILEIANSASDGLLSRIGGSEGSYTVNHKPVTHGLPYTYQKLPSIHCFPIIIPQCRITLFKNFITVTQCITHCR